MNNELEEETSIQRRLAETERQLQYLTNEFEAFKKYKIDRHLSYNCARGTCNACKGRSCRHGCHNRKLEEC